MKALDLKYWPLENHVIRISLILTLCLASKFANAQTNLDSITYTLITSIIAEDTIIKDVQLRTLKKGILSGKYSKEDSLKFVNSVKSRKFRLYKNRMNNSLKSNLQNDLKNGNERVVKYFGEIGMREIIASIPEDTGHDLTLIDNTIEIIEKSGMREFCHFFSAPIKIDTNRYLLYHYNHNNDIGGSQYYIIFTINHNDTFEIETRILISIS